MAELKISDFEAEDDEIIEDATDVSSDVQSEELNIFESEDDVEEQPTERIEEDVTTTALSSFEDEDDEEVTPTTSTTSDPDTPTPMSELFRKADDVVYRKR